MNAPSGLWQALMASDPWARQAQSAAMAISAISVTVHSILNPRGYKCTVTELAASGPAGRRPCWRTRLMTPDGLPDPQKPRQPETIWERGIRWPPSGPLRWLVFYLFLVTMAGAVIWSGLGFVSPTGPDPVTGHVYRVPGGRHAPDFYVREFDALALRTAAAHAGLLLLIFGGIGLFNAGAKPRRADPSGDPPPPSAL